MSEALRDMVEQMIYQALQESVPLDELIAAVQYEHEVVSGE